MSWNYGNLNLKGVRPQSTGSLPAGRYICKVQNAKLKDAANGCKQVMIELADEGGKGMTRDNITVYHPTSDQAQRIGHERLMALLTYGGHPHPEDHKDVRELNGLRVGVVVETTADTWTNDRGETVSGANKPKKNGAYFPPGGGGAGGAGDVDDVTRAAAWRAPAEPPTGKDLNDEIPF